MSDLACMDCKYCDIFNEYLGFCKAEGVHVMIIAPPCEQFQIKEEVLEDRLAGDHEQSH